MNKKLLMLIPLIAAISAVATVTVFDDNYKVEGEISSVIIPFSIEKASHVADYVIVGTIEKMTPIRVDMPKESDEDRVYTDIVINVKEDLLEQYIDKQISVRILGGEASNAKLIAKQSGEFSIGNEVLLFISAADSYTYGGNNFILAQHYGVYDIVGETAKNQGSDEIFNKVNLVSQVKQATNLQ